MEDEDGPITMQQGFKLVEEIVGPWSQKYVHVTRYLGRNEYEKPLRYETIFSLLHNERPVPVACVHVKFLIEADTGEISYQFEHEQVQHQHGRQTLAEGKFELWLDRIIRDKTEVRRLHALTTPFEETRLAPPPAYESEADEESEAESEDWESAAAKKQQQPGGGPAPDSPDNKGVSRLKRESMSLTNGLSLTELLSNIFDAADEENEFLLSHKEVANLLYATPLGLKEWDVKLLLTTAPENDRGLIEYKPFVQAAPEIVEALLRRREAFVARNKPTATVTSEAVELCFGDEMEEINRTTREAFSAADPSNTGQLQRSAFKQCLLSREERFSPQEVQMLMQMVEEDDFGNVAYEDFVQMVEKLRIAALHNALVETDVASLRVHLILLMRREGLAQDLLLPIWTLRKVLLSADQLCLSRMQVHVLLSVVQPNEYGWVDVAYFLRVVCTVIPYIFDAATFMEKAQEIAKEKADAQAKAELEELQGLTGGGLARSKKAEDEEIAEEKGGAQQMDREGVEKTLIHLGSMMMDRQGGNTFDVMRFLSTMRHETVNSCQLADHELRGFIAEASLDENGEINFVEHVKTWVPIVFELRKSRVYESILSKDWSGTGVGGAQTLVDLSAFEESFPILPHRFGGDQSDRRDSQGEADSKERVSKERLSGEHSRGSKKGSIMRSSTRFLAAVMTGSKGARGSKRGSVADVLSGVNLPTGSKERGEESGEPDAAGGDKPARTSLLRRGSSKEGSSGPLGGLLRKKSKEALSDKE